MDAKATGGSFDKELDAVKAILQALQPLDPAGQRFALKTAMDRLGITGLTAESPRGQTAAPPELLSTDDALKLNPKQFLKAKQPVTDVQRIVCLAYYLTYARKETIFKTANLTKLNTEAAGSRLSNAALSVRNATSQNGFLAPAGKGSKQITAHGEDVVRAMPDQAAVKKVLDGYKAPRKKRGGRRKRRADA